MREGRKEGCRAFHLSLTPRFREKKKKKRMQTFRSEWESSHNKHPVCAKAGCCFSKKKVDKEAGVEFQGLVSHISAANTSWLLGSAAAFLTSLVTPAVQGLVFAQAASWYDIPAKHTSLLNPVGPRSSAIKVPGKQSRWAKGCCWCSLHRGGTERLGEA